MESEKEIHFSSGNLQRCFDFFKEIRSNEVLCDITFQTESSVISAHRIILAASIPYFRESFLEKGGEDVTLDDIKPTIFERFVDYAYSHEMTINEKNVRDLLSGACHFGVEEVKEACCDFLADRLQPENVISLRDLACRLHCWNLLKDINRYISEHFVAVSQTKDFLDTPFWYVKELIGRDDLLVANEEKVFEAVMRWTKALPEERKVNLPELLRRVRMPLLKIDYITDTVGEEELIRTSFPCRDLLDEAKNCHFPELSKRKQNIISFTFEPRRFVKQTAPCQSTQNLLIYNLTMSTTYRVERFQGSKKEWKFIYGGSGEINACSFAALNHEIYFFVRGSSMKYSPKENKFRDIKQMPSPRSFCVAVSFKNEVIVCGGTFETAALNVVEAFDPLKDKWSSLRPMRQKRAGPSAVTLGDFIYVLGGTDYSTVYNSVERYDSEIDKWHFVSHMLSKRCIGSAATVKGKIYVCGGDSSPKEGVLNCISTAEVYDPTLNTWSYISPMKTSRCENIVLSYNEKLYVLGGFDSSRKCSSTVEIYDPECDRWEFGPSPKFTDFFLSCAVAM